jgi:hypothetical protein
MADARDVFYRERDAIAAAFARGENPYGGYENAVNSIYNTYGRNSGVSFQEVQGIIGQAYQNAGETIPTSTTSGSGGATTSYGTKVWNGRVYNLDDPTQRDAFIAARNQDLQDQLTQANADVDYNASQDFASTTKTYQDKVDSLNKDLNKYNTNADDYSKQLANLYEGYGQGNVARQNYFTRLSPDSYQSGQGSSAKYATEKYQQGYGETDQARNEWKGSLDKGLTDTGTAYNNWVAAQQRSIAQQKQENANKFNSARDQMSEAGIQYGQKASYGAFTPAADVTARNVDVSAYTPYINFQALQQSPGANNFKKFLPGQSQDPLAQTLGYTLPTKASDPMNQYLYSR